MVVAASILVIGNEIISGRTQDSHICYLAKRLEELGIDLKEARIIPDEIETIASHINCLRSSYDYLFTTGGIGSTHDDITSKSLAQAFHVELVKNLEIEAILIEKYGNPISKAYERLTFVPKGSKLIENSISFVPGFSLENVFCFAGFPSIARSMFESIVPKLKKGKPVHTKTSIFENIKEGDIAILLEAIQTKYLNVCIGSYPFYTPSQGVTLVVKGRCEKEVQDAMKSIQEMIREIYQ